MTEMEDLIIPDSFDYEKVSAISAEALQKFKKIKPRTLRTSRKNKWCKPKRYSNINGVYGEVKYFFCSPKTQRTTKRSLIFFVFFYYVILWRRAILFLIFKLKKYKYGVKTNRYYQPSI
ncbi:MAG: hypothetical protein V9E96_18085 [Chitinophagaceae bacterium]